MRTVITGTVGLDKVAYLEKVEAIARGNGIDVTLCHVGERMYVEAPDVANGRILDLPLSRLTTLRRSVFKDILVLSETSENLIVNTHATFRWKHGLFPAFDFDQLSQLNPDIFICLLDNVDALHARLERDHQIDHSLKDLLVWREEETLATELMMKGCSLKRSEGPGRFYVLATGQNAATAEMCYRLMFQQEIPKAYISFPMTHVSAIESIMSEIEEFRKQIGRHLVVFDPSDLEEQGLYLQALDASKNGHKVIESNVLGRRIRFDVAEVLQVAGDFHAQIYARDFMLIDQSDMIISYIPQLPGGGPGLSSGVERELQHAHEAAKDVYIIWKPKVDPSPFVTETATKIFPTTEKLLEHFQTLGTIPNAVAPQSTHS